MNIKKKTKKALTLLEIMIVVFLIGLIGSVIGYNMKGSLDEGRAFKTEQAKAKIHDLLLLEVAKGKSIEEVVEKRREHLQNSGIAKDVDKLLKDGWGEEFSFTVSDGDIFIESAKLLQYNDKKERNLQQEKAKKGKATGADLRS